MFGAGLLPPLVQNINISNANRITFSDDTFSNLTRLRNIHLNNIGTLRIGKTNWMQDVHPEHMTITINDSKVLDLDSGAFSGLRSPGPRINIRNIFSCNISGSAFNSDSSIQGVVLQNINMLRLNDGAFRADIDQLKLENINIPEDTYCGNNFFGGRIGNLSLISVKISEVRGGCLQAGDGWGSLTIRSSILGNIQSLGISGNISDVVIEGSHLRSVDHHGLQMNTSTFKVYDAKIEELKEDAFDVRFNLSASLQKSNITLLKAHALRQLSTLDREGPTLAVRGVTVAKAEYGSLELSEHTNLTLRDVVLGDQLCRCGAVQEALRLMLGRESPHDATGDQRQTAQQIVQQVHCTTGTTTPTLAEFHCRDCSVTDEDRPMCSRLVSRAAVDVWVWPVCGVALLLLLTAAVVITLMKRKRRQSQELQPADEYQSIEDPKPTVSLDSKRTVPPDSPSHGEIPVTLRPSEWQSAPAGAVISTPAGADALDPEPLYTEVGPRPPDKPPPGTRTTQYIEMASPPVHQYDNCDVAGQPLQHAVYENADPDTAPNDQRPMYTNV